MLHIVANMDADPLSAPSRYRQGRQSYGQNWYYQDWGNQSRSGGQPRWENRGWSQAAIYRWSGPWPSSGATSSSSRAPPPPPAAPAADSHSEWWVRPSSRQGHPCHASSLRSTPRSMARRTPSALTLMARLSLSLGRVSLY